MVHPTLTVQFCTRRDRVILGLPNFNIPSLSFPMQVSKIWQEIADQKAENHGSSIGSYTFSPFLPARASEQGNVIGSVRIYIYIRVPKKFVIERTRDLIYLKFVATDFFPKIISPSVGENSGGSVRIYIYIYTCTKKNCN